MLLFPEDIEAVNDLLKKRAGMDPELYEACQPHIKLGQYDVAVFKAFRVLEGRVQRRSGIRGETASKTLVKALGSQGPLTERLGLTPRQAANLRDLIGASFSVFRNPEAHPQEAIVEYGSAECQAVLAFVNLMLGVLNRKPQDPMQAARRRIRASIGSDAARRLEAFLERISSFNWKIDQHKLGFSYRALALRAWRPESSPKKMRTTVFILRPEDPGPKFVFPVREHWASIPGLDREAYAKRLLALGCVDGWAGQELDLDLREHNSADLFERLYVIVRGVVEAMDRSRGI